MSTWKILLLLATALLAGFMVLPWREEVQTMTDQMTVLENQQTKGREKLVEVKEAEIRTSDNPEELLEKIPRTQSQEEMIRDMERLATRYDFSPQQMSFTNRTEKDQRGGILRASVVMSGPKIELAPMLQAIEQNDRYMNVETLGVKVSLTDAGQAVTLSMTIEAYYQS